jgi:Mg/Co/Ni transporter MgtE
MQTRNLATETKEEREYNEMMYAKMFYVLKIIGIIIGVIVGIASLLKVYAYVYPDSSISKYLNDD